MPSSSGYERAPDPVEVLAHRLLVTYGCSPERATRPEHSWSNEVWLGETAVVRISRAFNGSLAREAALAAILSPDVGYPEVHGHGVAEGMEWMVTERLRGTNLEIAWPTLDRSTRGMAATDLWTRLEAVHRTDVDAARAMGCTDTPFYALNKTDARQLLDWLLRNEAIESALHGRLAVMLDQMFHTDAGPHNAVWDGTNAVPIDFEFASVAPADLDLENVLRTLALQGEPDPTSAVLEQAADLVARPGAEARLWGYAVLRDLWGLRGWLRHARAGSDLEEWGAQPHDLHTWAPWLHLQRHATRTSWLAEALGT